MRKIHIKTGKEYDVLIGPGLLGQAGELALAALGGPCRAAVICDGNVGPLYLDTLCEGLKAAGFDTVSFCFEAGEQNKNLGVWAEMLGFLAGEGLGRGDAVFALGGGVCGDMAGFAAAVYRRGVRCVQLPTTLLSAVDSSVGGKTAVDLPQGKNLAGAFHQPSLVICDTDCLRSLPPDVFADGLSEALKCGIIGDPALFEALGGGVGGGAFGSGCSGKTFGGGCGGADLCIEDVIAACVELKRSVVEDDEFDTGRRKLLNLGHTFGHAIESVSGYRLSHGKAVAMGTVLISTAACAKGLLGAGELGRIEAAFAANGLPTECPYGAGEVNEAALSDKKLSGGAIDLIVPRAVGRCDIMRVPAAELPEWLKAGGLKERADAGV